MKHPIVKAIYPLGPWCPITKVVFNSKDYGVVTLKTREEKTVPDLFKDFKDWLEYNHPEVKLSSLQNTVLEAALETSTTNDELIKKLEKLLPRPKSRK